MGTSVRYLLLVVLCALGGAAASRGQVIDAGPEERLKAFERRIAVDPEDLRLAADYRQVIISVGKYDRAIDFLENLAKQPGSGPNIHISHALAYVDKVPPSGDLRRLYLARDALAALSESIKRRPSVLAYHVRGVTNLYFNRFMFNRTDKGVADLQMAASLLTPQTPPALVAMVYTALGDGYYKLDDLTKARDVWASALMRFPEDAGLKARLAAEGHALSVVVTDALSAGRRVDTSLTAIVPPTP